MLKKRNLSESEKEGSHEDENFLNDNMKEKGQFKNFAICQKTQEHLKQVGIQYLFPIQQETFTPIYEGKDLIGQDRTGSGKTLAFSLPVLESFRKKNAFERRGKNPMVVVVVPTRELATQVSKEFERFMNKEGEYVVGCFYGGN